MKIWTTFFLCVSFCCSQRSTRFFNFRFTAIEFTCSCRRSTTSTAQIQLQRASFMTSTFRRNKFSFVLRSPWAQTLECHWLSFGILLTQFRNRLWSHRANRARKQRAACRVCMKYSSGRIHYQKLYTKQIFLPGKGKSGDIRQANEFIMRVSLQLSRSRTHKKCRVAEQKHSGCVSLSWSCPNFLCPTTRRERNRSKSWQRDYKAFKSVQNLAET